MDTYVVFTVHCLVLVNTFSFLYSHTVRLGVFPYSLVFFFEPICLYRVFFTAVSLCMMACHDMDYSVLRNVRE
jgi:hypothetical protein